VVKATSAVPAPPVILTLPVVPARTTVSASSVAPAPSVAQQLTALLTDTFEHYNPAGIWESSYGKDGNFIIVEAVSQSPGGCRVSLPIAHFEIRWGSECTSEHMPEPTTGFIHVNLNSGNTRIV
jgi:hypothetical protein